MELTPKKYLEPPVDWEYKYLLTMATIDKISKDIDNNILYPTINKLQKWERKLKSFINKMEALSPGSSEITYIPEIIVEQEYGSMEDFLDLMKFAYKNINILLQKAELKLKELEKKIHIKHIGIYSLDKYEGILLVKKYNELEKYIYKLLRIESDYIFPYFEVYWLGSNRYINFSGNISKTSVVSLGMYNNPSMFLVEVSGALSSYSAVIPISMKYIKKIPEA